MTETILVTGGAGYIGSQLTRLLLACGFRVRVLDSFLYGGHGLADLYDHPELDWIEGDVGDPQAVSQAVQGVGCVVALAAIVGDDACEVDPKLTQRTNCESTGCILDACRRHAVRRLVFASSCSVYGATDNELLTETSPLHPVSRYAWTRVLSEQHLQREAGGVEIVILRLATVCGASPRMRFDLMVNAMTARALTTGTIPLSAPAQWRPHLHVRDAAAAFAHAAVVPEAAGQIFNIGSADQNLTIREVAERIADFVPGTGIELDHGPSDACSYRVSFAKANALLGFAGDHTIDDAVLEVIDLFRSGRVVDPAHPRYSNLESLRSREETALRPTNDERPLGVLTPAP